MSKKVGNRTHPRLRVTVKVVIGSWSFLVQREEKDREVQRISLMSDCYIPTVQVLSPIFIIGMCCVSPNNLNDLL